MADDFQYLGVEAGRAVFEIGALIQQCKTEAEEYTVRLKEAASRRQAEQGQRGGLGSRIAGAIQEIFSSNTPSLRVREEMKARECREKRLHLAQEDWKLHLESVYAPKQLDCETRMEKMKDKVALELWNDDLEKTPTDKSDARLEQLIQKETAEFKKQCPRSDARNNRIELASQSYEFYLEEVSKYKQAVCKKEVQSTVQTLKKMRTEHDKQKLPEHYSDYLIEKEISFQRPRLEKKCPQKKIGIE